MKLVGGLHKDSAPNDQKPSTYRHAENALLTKLDYAVATEPGTTAFYNREGYTAVGVIPVRDDASVLFYVADTYFSGSSYLSEIVYLDSEGNETPIVSHADLAFSPEHPFKGVYYYNPNDELVVAWTDNNNPPRILNIDAPGFDTTTPDAKYIKRMSLFAEAMPPSVKGDLVSNETGSIQNGAYTFFVAYEIDDQVGTNFLGGYGSYLVGDGLDYDGKTSIGISLDIKNLDTDYDYVRLYVVRTENAAKTGHYITRLQIPSSGELDYVWTGKTLGEESYEDIIINNASYKTAKSLTVLNDRLHLANLTTDTFFDYQPYANAITSEWTFEENLTSISRKDKQLSPEEYGSYRGFMPGATYAFYISFVLKDGTYSPAYHIPGRLSEDASVYGPINADTPLRNIDVNDYSTYSGTVTEQDVHAGTDYTFHYGAMSYHRNETETYPTSDSWLVKNGLGSITANLQGAPVMHHKFPSVQKMAANIANFNQRNIVYGVRFNNIALPSALRDKVKGYTIFYAARDFGDMDVLTYLPVLDKDFQDAENWDPAGSYPVEPGCYETTPTACYGYEIKNNSYQNDAKISYTDCAGVPQLKTLYPGQVFETTADQNSVTILQGDVTITTLGSATAPGSLGCDEATVLSGSLRVYDPMILAKKPSLTNLYTVPEWYKNVPWKNTSGNNLDNQAGYVSDLGEFKYIPANNEVEDNAEREEAGIFTASRIVAGRWRGKSTFLEKGIEGYISNQIMISSLRQYVPNIYVGYNTQTLASTSVVFDLRNPSLSDTFISGSLLAMYARTPRIYGGDVTLASVQFLYMTKEDNNNTDMYDDTNDEVLDKNHHGYTYFKDNVECNSVRRAHYVTPSRLPISKMYEDPGLKPVLNFKGITYYAGEYLNQYLINPAYETINTTKPAFPYDDVASDFVTQFPTRIARSVVQQSENSKLQWRKFRSQDYYEHVRNKGEITNIEEYNGELIIHHEHSIFKTIGKEQLASDAASVYLGTGDIFNLPPREIIDTPTGYAGAQHLSGVSLTKAGYFFTDVEQAKIFNIGAQLNEISNKGLRNWLRSNLPFKLKDQLKAKGIAHRYDLWDAPAHKQGNGFAVTFDEEYNRFLISKRSWKFTNTGLAKLASEAQYNDPYALGYIYIVNNGLYVGVPGRELPGVVELDPFDMNETDVEYTSWTLSYSPAIDAWVSYHSYKPSLMWSTRNKVFSFTDQIHQHNVGNVGTYYGVTYPTMIDIVFNPAPNETKVFSNFNWITECINTSEGSVKKETFTSATVYNSYQLSQKLALVNNSNIREKEGTWHFNAFRDLLDTPDSDIVSEYGVIDYGLLDVSKPWYEQRRFIDKYITLRLEADNLSNKYLYLYEVSAAARASYR